MDNADQDEIAKESDFIFHQETFWGDNLVSLLTIQELGKVQQLDRKFYLMMQPSSEKCQVDFKAMFDIDVARQGYSSLE